MESSDPIPEGDNYDPPSIEMHPDLSQRNRNHARRRNPSAKYVPVKVVLGGVAGLALGQLILWWLPLPFRRDPVQLAPQLPAAVAFLAPASLRHTPHIAIRPAALTNHDGAADSILLTNDVTADASSLADLVKAASKPPESPKHLIGLSDIRLVSMHELELSLERASTSQDAFKAKEDWTPTAVQSWYTDLCSLAHDVTFADTRDVNIHVFANETRKFLVHVAEDPRRLRAIVAAATKSIADSNNHRQGIVLVGTVTDISAGGEMFQTELKLGEDNSVKVMSRVDPRDNPGMAHLEGLQVLIVGVVICEPSLYLLGYRGDADTVVWGGMPVKLPQVR